VDLVNEPNGIATWGTYDHHTDWRLAATDLALYIVNNAKDYHGLFFIQGKHAAEVF
jgi:aryl-phospho-beta-D-glucosidase BglC (GH1 family)